LALTDPSTAETRTLAPGARSSAPVDDPGGRCQTPAMHSVRSPRGRLISLGLALLLPGLAGCRPPAPDLPAYSAGEIQHLEELARGGDAESAFLRGVIEQQGLGLPAAPARAVPWLEQAAGLGHAPAELALGQLWLTGDGVVADPARAAHWFGRAADRGRADAQYQLAQLHRAGTGVTRDPVQALKWLLLASRGSPHVKEASVELSSFTNQLTAAQVAEGTRLAAAFQPTPPATPPARAP